MHAQLVNDEESIPASRPRGDTAAGFSYTPAKCAPAVKPEELCYDIVVKYH